MATSPENPISVVSPVDGFDVDQFARKTIDDLWNRRNFENLGHAYREDFVFAGPTNRAFLGTKNYKQLLSSLLQCFPDIEIQVDEVYWMGNDNDGYLTSERWSAEGSHTGDGIFGEATGKPVQIWGITQHEIVNRQIVKEWMLFNELDLMMQIAAK